MAATKKAQAKAEVDLKRFGLFVSLNPKQLVPVTRWGTSSFIAAMRDPKDTRKIHYFPGQVVAIPAEEYRRYRSEYDDAIRAGDLLRRTEADYQASQKARAEEQDKLHKAKAQQRKEAEVAAKKAAESSPTQEVANGTELTDSAGD